MDDDLESCKKRLFYYLSLRSHTQKELENKLSHRFSTSAVKDAVEYATERGFICDEDTAKMRAEALLREKKSINEVRQKLSIIGIERETIEEILEDATDTDNINKLLCGRYSAKMASGEYKKVAAALLRQGFRFSEVKAALLEYIELIED